MRRLVESWVEAEKIAYRNTLGGAIEELNRECGVKLTYSRLAEWRRGCLLYTSTLPTILRV